MKKSRNISNLDIVSNVIAYMYPYPSNAKVWIGKRFAKIVESANKVDYDYENDMLVIDGIKYRYGEEDSVEYSYHDESLTFSEEKALMKEADKLFKQFEKLDKTDKNCYYAFLENINPDGYIASLIYIIPEK